MYFIDTADASQLTDTILTAAQWAAGCYIDVHDNCIHSFPLDPFTKPGYLVDALTDDQLIMLKLRGINIMPVDYYTGVGYVYNTRAHISSAALASIIDRNTRPEFRGVMTSRTNFI